MILDDALAIAVVSRALSMIYEKGIVISKR